MRSFVIVAALCVLLAGRSAEQIEIPASEAATTPSLVTPRSTATHSIGGNSNPGPSIVAPVATLDSATTAAFSTISATVGPSSTAASATVQTFTTIPAVSSPTTSSHFLAATEVKRVKKSQCVHIGEDQCPPPGELCRCKLLNDTDAVICCDITAQLQLKESLNCEGLAGANITALHARNVTLSSLDVSIFNLTRLYMPHLQSLAVTDGHISQLRGHLDAPNLVCLNLSTNSLGNVTESPFSSLTSLVKLDLSGNELQELFLVNSRVPKFEVDVSGNKRLRCSSITEIMKTVKNLNFANDNSTFCTVNKSFTWFNSTDQMPLSFYTMLNKLEQDCPQGETGRCLCKVERLDLLLGQYPRFSVSVDCFNRSLTKLPEFLPENTITFNVSNNHITSLDALGKNEHYKNIRHFKADNNQITSITALEGSPFIDEFTYLGLQNNNLSSIPLYIMSHVFDRNNHKREIHLGQNQLKCDCSTVKEAKFWLNANKINIPDYNEVTCENMQEKVYELDAKKVCTVQSSWTEYVYYIVAAEVMMLVLLVSKVSYDYWVFKTAGYLPWPASKMPKLPCDWVFE